MKTIKLLVNRECNYETTIHGAFETDDQRNALFQAAWHAVHASRKQSAEMAVYRYGSQLTPEQIERHAREDADEYVSHLTVIEIPVGVYDSGYY